MKFIARFSKILIVTLSLALFSVTALANIQRYNDRASSLSQEDYDVYLSTLKRCVGTNKVSSLWKGMNYEVAASSATSIFKLILIDTNTTFEFVENKGLSPEFNRILHSMGFYAALNDCYGDDDVAKQAYFAGLLLSDAAGKIGSLRMAVAALASIKGLTVIGKVSPHALAMFQAAGVTGAIYYAYNTIHNEFKPRNIEEKQKIESVQKQALEHPLIYVASAKILIDEKILELERRLNSEDLSSVERENMQNKILKLRRSLKEINELEQKVS